MVSKIKVTDGDLLLVNIKGNGVSQDYMEKFRNRLEKWASKKGLSNVEVMVSGGDINIDITQISVNDVFEEEVLKGDIDSENS